MHKTQKFRSKHLNSWKTRQLLTFFLTDFQTEECSLKDKFPKGILLYQGKTDCQIRNTLLPGINLSSFVLMIPMGQVLILPGLLPEFIQPLICHRKRNVISTKKTGLT